MLLLLLFPFIWFAIALDVVEVAVAKLGFSPNVALLLFAGVVLGSIINIPLYERVSRVSVIPDFADLWMGRFWGIPLRQMEQKTVVADLLHLREIERMTADVLSIGGAGVFDGIALCGLFALLLT
ncbi:MAG TPA: DUF1614 domain-containing protein [Crinalium sp.]